METCRRLHHPHSTSVQGWGFDAMLLQKRLLWVVKIKNVVWPLQASGCERTAINPSLCEQADTCVDISCVPFQNHSNRRKTHTPGWRKRLIKYRTEKVAGGLVKKKKKIKIRQRKNAYAAGTGYCLHTMSALS